MATVILHLPDIETLQRRATLTDFIPKSWQNHKITTNLNYPLPTRSQFYSLVFNTFHPSSNIIVCSRVPAPVTHIFDHPHPFSTSYTYYSLVLLVFKHSDMFSSLCTCPQRPTFVSEVTTCSAPLSHILTCSWSLSTILEPQCESRCVYTCLQLLSTVLKPYHTPEHIPNHCQWFSSPHTHLNSFASIFEYFWTATTVFNHHRPTVSSTTHLGTPLHPLPSPITYTYSFSTVSLIFDCLYLLLTVFIHFQPHLPISNNIYLFSTDSIKLCSESYDKLIIDDKKFWK